MYMADNPAISSLQLLTIVYYNNCGNYEALHESRSTRKPLYSVGWVGGGGGGGGRGRKLGALV